MILSIKYVWDAVQIQPMIMALVSLFPNPFIVLLLLLSIISNANVQKINPLTMAYNVFPVQNHIFGIIPPWIARAVRRVSFTTNQQKNAKNAQRINPYFLVENVLVALKEVIFMMKFALNVLMVLLTLMVNVFFPLSNK